MTIAGTPLVQRASVLQSGMQQQGVDVLIIGPGPDLEYVTQMQTDLMERLYVLVIPANDEPFLVLPKLEENSARDGAIGRLGIPTIPWIDQEDSFARLAAELGSPSVIAVNDDLPARWLLGIMNSLEASQFVSGSQLLAPLRMRKSSSEIESLREAAEAIDEVQSKVARWLKPGRTEAEVGSLIREAILERHSSADFIIVGSGPNSASPHHGVSDRILEVGDPIVIDIGGTMPSGYCSDTTRMYHLGKPDNQYLADYAALLEAQSAARAAVTPGQTCAEIDQVARRVLEAAGLGEYFVHRTGHGIGLETHEDPYIVTGNDQVLEPGFAFSVEPGFYVPGKWGARIEDIVVCTDGGVESLNRRPRELVVIDV